MSSYPLAAGHSSQPRSEESWVYPKGYKRPFHVGTIRHGQIMVSGQMNLKLISAMHSYMTTLLFLSDGVSRAG